MLHFERINTPIYVRNDEIETRAVSTIRSKNSWVFVMWGAPHTVFEAEIGRLSVILGKKRK